MEESEESDQDGQFDNEVQRAKDNSSRSAHDNMDAYKAKGPINAKNKKDELYSDEDSSNFAQGEEYTNVNNINSNRHDANFEGIEQISDDDDNL